MPLIWYLIIAVVAAIALYFLMPKPETQPPPGVGEVEAPTAKEGQEIPVLFGTRVLNGPNVVWYGDIKTSPKKVNPCEGGKK